MDESFHRQKAIYNWKYYLIKYFESRHLQIKQTSIHLYQS